MCWAALELECGHIVLKTQSICCEKLLGFEYAEPVSCFLCDTELLLDNHTLTSFCKQKLSIKPWYKVVFTGYAQNLDDEDEQDDQVDEIPPATMFVYDLYGNLVEVAQPLPAVERKGRKKWTTEKLEEFLMWQISLDQVVDLSKESDLSSVYSTPSGSIGT